MNNIKTEDILVYATIFSIELAKCYDKDKLEKIKLFFQNVSSNLQALISNKK